MTMEKTFADYRKQVYASINGIKGSMIRLGRSKLLSKAEKEKLAIVINALDVLRSEFYNNRGAKPSAASLVDKAETTLLSKPDAPSWVGGDSIPDESSWFMCVADGVKQPMRFNRHNLFWMDLAGKTYKPGEIEKWLDA